MSIVFELTIVQFKLIDSRSLPEFPSGSSILFADNRLYLFGDDAKTMLILDRGYKTIGEVELFIHPGKRVPKDKKIDVEATVFVKSKRRKQVLAFGSASELNREILVLLSINKNKKPSLIDYSLFVDRLRKIGIREINIEGATQVGSRLLLVNRGNQTNRKNHLIITTPDFWKDQEHCTIVVHELSTAVAQSDFLGVSEVHYVKSIDLLLFTFTSESTMNSYDDGIIGESYLGWIRSASKNRLDSVTELRRLSDIHGELKGQKIEGVCADEIGEDYLQLHLVADNDEGESKLFKVEMTLDER